MARRDKIKTFPSPHRPAPHPACGNLHTRCVLPVKQISAEGTFCYRYRLEDPELRMSVRARGILMPLLITNDKRPLVIAGHKRLHLARSLKIKNVPVLTVGKMGSKDAFFLNLVSNWKQGCSDVDRARALETAAGRFYFKEHEILSEVMPLLGLPGNKALWEFYRKIDRFPDSLKDLVEKGQLPVRAIQPFLKFAKDDQDYFAKKIGAKFALTNSQMLQAGEWFSEMTKRTGKCLNGLCAQHKLFANLDRKKTDPRTQADRFFARVKRLRFPGASLYHKVFEEKRSEILRGIKEFRLEPVQGFEEPGFELHARVRNSVELERFLAKLSEKCSSLNSLFEIAL